jgi:hypothetical protein
MGWGNGMSLQGTATTNTAGKSVTFRTPVSKALFSVAFPGGGGTTKCSVRVEIQGPGPSTRWTQIGTAATTVKSTQSGTAFYSTSAIPFTKARLRLITRSTGSGAGADAVSATLTGV